MTVTKAGWRVAQWQHGLRFQQFYNFAMAFLGFKLCGVPLQPELLERSAKESVSKGNHKMIHVIYRKILFSWHDAKTWFNLASFCTNLAFVASFMNTYNSFHSKFIISTYSNWAQLQIFCVFASWVPPVWLQKHPTWLSQVRRGRRTKVGVTARKSSWVIELPMFGESNDAGCCRVIFLKDFPQK